MRSVLILLAGCALASMPATMVMAQDNPRNKSTTDRAETVVSQPFKDLGAMRQNPPEILIDAQKAPYSLAGLRNCKGYVAEIRRLDEVLGPDLDKLDEEGKPQAGQVAQAGASMIINSIIPFRGLVREATGAAAADRRLQQMIAAGIARRGFLKGYARGRGCRL